MVWFIYAVISIVFISFASLLQRILMKDEESDPVSYSIVFQLLAALLAGVFVFFKGFEMLPIKAYPLNFLLEAVLYAFSTLFTFKALKTIQASQAVIIVSFSCVVTVIFSAIFLREILTFQRLAGTLLIIVSVVLVSRLKSFSINRGILYALGAAVFSGLAVVNDTYLLRFSDAVSYTPIAFLLPGILLLLFYPKSVKKFKSFLKPKVAKNMILLSLFWVTSAIAFYLAIGKGALASQISPISQSKVILTVLLAVIFLKEKDNLLIKSLGAVLTMAGVLMIK